MCAKHYENLTMLSRVTTKNVGDVFETQCRESQAIGVLIRGMPLADFGPCERDDEAKTRTSNYTQ